MGAGRGAEGPEIPSEKIIAVRSVSADPYASLNTLIVFLSSAVLNTEVAVFPELVVA